MSFRIDRRKGLAVALSLLGASGCVGDIGGEPSPDPNAPSDEVANEVGVSGARRLTAIEYRNAVFDLVGVDVDDAALVLPTDDRTPFDNDFTKQISSQALIDGADLLAGEVAKAVVADPALRGAIMPCEPSGAADEACFRSFVEDFGRSALRRPLSEDETNAFVDHFMPHAQTAGDFWTAVDSALRAFLQHPAFLFRLEIGTPIDGVPGMVRLDDYEIATRLSFLLWGSTPPRWLLDQADAGELTDPATLKEAAAKLLEDGRAIERLSTFHAMWLSYEQLPVDAELAADMQAETTALLQRYLLEEHRPWSDLLTANETFVTPALAEHYGLPAPANAAGEWVPYGDSGRTGLLSHGTFLGAVAKFADTSPTQRGLLIRTRLFCMNIERPPASLMVNSDMPPQAPDPDACKEDTYTMWKTDGCKQCHLLMDPVGFGLERFDSQGRYRDTEPDRPDCPIEGGGTLQGVGDFNGPAQLGQLMIQSGDVDACVATELYRYAAGRFALDEHDQALIDRLVLSAREGDDPMRLDDFIEEYVASEAFQLRRDEEVQP